MTSLICSVRGCHNNWKKRRLFLEQECYEHRKRRSECCGPRFNFYPPPTKAKELRLWLKALNLKRPPKKPYVCSFHFVDKKPTAAHPYPEKWLGYEAPVKKNRRVPVRSSGASTSDAAEERNVEMPVTCSTTRTCDVSTQWEDPTMSDNRYVTRALRLWPRQCKETTQRAPEEVHVRLLRNDRLCLLYTGLPLYAFNCLADNLTLGCINSFQISPRDQLLMTLMKLRLNLLQDDIAERFGVTKPLVSKIVSCWLDFMDEKVRCYVSAMPRQTIQTTMPHFFQEHYPKVTCFFDCFETPLQKPHNLDSRDECYSYYYGQNTIKYLVGIAPCGFITFISPTYGGRCSDKIIMAKSGFVDCLRPGDEVMADTGFVTPDLLHERKVKLNPPALTKNSLQLSEDATNSRRIAEVRVHIEQVMRRLKNFRITCQTVPINLAPKFDKILRVCAALCNLLVM